MFKHYRDRFYRSKLSKPRALSVKKNKSTLVIDTAAIHTNKPVIDTVEPSSPRDSETPRVSETVKKGHVDEIERENTLLLSQENLESVLTPQSSQSDDTDAAIAKALHLIHNYIPEKKTSVMTAVSRRWKNALSSIRTSKAKSQTQLTKCVTEEYNWIMKSVNERVMIELKIEEDENTPLVHERPFYLSLDYGKRSANPPFFSADTEVKIINFLRCDLNNWESLCSRDGSKESLDDTASKFNSTFLMLMLKPKNEITPKSLPVDNKLTTIDDCVVNREPLEFKVGIEIGRLCKKILNEDIELKKMIKEDLVPNQFRFPGLFGQSEIDIVFEQRLSEEVLVDEQSISNDDRSSHLGFDQFAQKSEASLHPLEGESMEPYVFQEYETMLQRKKLTMQSQKKSTGMISVQQLQRLNDIMEEGGMEQIFGQHQSLKRRTQPKKHLRRRSLPEDTGSMAQKLIHKRHQRFSTEALKKLVLEDTTSLKMAREYLFPHSFGNSALDIGTELENV